MRGYLRAIWGDLTSMPDLSEGLCLSGDGQVAHFEAQGYDGDDRHVTSRTIGLAKRVCRRCPVEVECGIWAIEKGIPDGIYGGLTASERDARKRRAA